ncbi:MAG: sigma-E factor negative regulatory protein [Gammaproteobacteria bacterium]|nr:sigma-E factor negative regulatory protein [Gammaproteobacteria bacterium]
MNDKVSERLSALMDDEVPSGEEELVLRRLAREEGLRRRWARYHLIRDVMRHELPPRVPRDGLTEGVRQAVAAESPAGRRSRRVLKPVAGVALAASVAVAVLAGLDSLGGRSDPGPAARMAAASGTGYTRMPATRWDRAEPSVEHRLNNYLVNHSEYSASTGMHGLVPYVRIAGYDTVE